MSVNTDHTHTITTFQRNPHRTVLFNVVKILFVHKLFAYLAYILLSFTCSLSVCTCLTSRFEYEICHINELMHVVCMMWIYLPKMNENISWILHYLFIKLMIFSDITCMRGTDLHDILYIFQFIESDFFTSYPRLKSYVLRAVFFLCHWNDIKNSGCQVINISFLPNCYSTVGLSFHFHLFKLLLSWLRGRRCKKKAYFYC